MTLKVIVLQNVSDHIMGTQDLVDVNKDRSGQIEIIMHSTTAEEMTRYSKYYFLHSTCCSEEVFCTTSCH